MERFLIIKTSAIGDVIQTLPLITYLKRRFPGCQVDWASERTPAPLLEAHPDIERVLVIDTKRWRKNLWSDSKEIVQFIFHMRSIRYDAVFDLQGNTKSGLVAAFSKARNKVGFGWRSLREKVSYFATDTHYPAMSEGNERVRNLDLLLQYFGDDEPVSQTPLKLNLTKTEEEELETIVSSGASPKVMVCLGSNWENKRPSEKGALSFLKQVAKEIDPSFFFVYGSEKERQEAERLAAAFPLARPIGRMTLPLWQTVMGEMDLVISVDSAALHLCGTTSTPSFSLFGPSSSLCYKPFGSQHTAFQGTCPYGEQFGKRCRRLRTCETGACMKEVDIDALFATFQRFWMSVSKSIPCSTT